MTPEEYIDQMKIQEVSWNGDICENEPTGDYILSEEDALEAVRMAREGKKNARNYSVASCLKPFSKVLQTSRLTKKRSSRN